LKPADLNIWALSTYRIKAFGITREILGGKEAVVEVAGTSVQELRAVLYRKYPSLKGLRSLMIAVNNEYAGEEDLLAETDEIALIPPVSGG
jgi:sulfur-carrier protein